MNIKIKYMTDIKPITVSDNGDWIDLRAAIDIDLNFLEFTYIPLGVCMELPKGYSAIIAPRSSTYKKWGIVVANSIGIIDESYNGDHDEWHMPVIALRHTHIYKNDRICQFRIIKKSPDIEFVPVTTLGNVNRGGLGSTGEN
jgi:dUTP pyrophosphatase